MSELKVNSIKGVAASTAAITVNNTDGTCTANLKSIAGGQLAGFRNLVINGDMKIHQRAQSVTGVTSGYQTADRFYLRRTASSTFDSNVTNGVLTCNNPSASTGFDIRHGIEWDDVFYGKTMTVSFNATAAVGGVDLTVEVMDGSIANTAATTYAHLTGTTTDVQDLVVTPVSGTRYEVTVDIPADGDVSFTPDILRLRFGNAVADASQSFALSKVQFEFGTVATEFELEPYATTLLKCQRYYHVIFDATQQNTTYWQQAYYYNNSTLNFIKTMNPEMRATPSLECTSTTGVYRAYRNGTYNSIDDFTISHSSKRSARIYTTGSFGSVAGFGAGLYVSAGTNEKIALRAEL